MRRTAEFEVPIQTTILHHGNDWALTVIAERLAEKALDTDSVEKKRQFFEQSYVLYKLGHDANLRRIANYRLISKELSALTPTSH